ncbi:MAG: hypothetical protein IJ519_01015 [Clostridia bacterium]|nr:hypothetical protein [Clostridia bacterium]
MDILDFEFSSTPVILCEQDGRIISCNPAARSLRPTPRKGARMKVAVSPCRLPQGKCLVIPYEERLWLLFCDFLQFDYNGAIYPTTLEAVLLSGPEILRAAATYGSIRRAPAASAVKRFRDLLYSRFRYIFAAQVDPFRAHSVCALISAFTRVLPSEHVRFSAEAGSMRLVNTRNAAIMMTSLISILLPFSGSRVSASAGAVGNDLRLCVSARTNIPFPDAHEEDLTSLFRYFPEHTVDLYVADLCIRTCGYTVSCHTCEDGSITVDVYVKTETRLNSVLDPSMKVPFEAELAHLSKKLSQTSANELHQGEGAPHG